MLCECEPQLKELESDIKDARGRGEPGRLWYNTFKPRLVRLVGWESGAPDDHPIGTMEAYDICLQHFVKMLFAVRPKPRKGRFSLRPANAVDGPQREQRDWRRIAKRFRKETGDTHEPSLYDLAVSRLSNGDVSETKYGIRVAVREDLGDDRVEAAAYWPANRACLCYSRKSRGYCSHELAVAIFTFERERHTPRSGSRLHPISQ
jgi:hypothetical protein